MPKPKNLFTPSTGVKEKVKCHLCNKFLRFDHLRDVHFPKEHKQPYKRPVDKDQVPITSIFQKRSKDDSELGAVGGKDTVISDTEETVMSEDESFDVPSPRPPHSSLELQHHKEVDPRPKSAPPSVRSHDAYQQEINFKIL